MADVSLSTHLASGFPAYVVRQAGEGKIVGDVESISLDQLPPGDVVIEVAWSSINFKDSLAARGHQGVVRQLPHVPGVDAVGRIVHSDHPDWHVGQEVIVTGNELGAGRWGGWSRLIRVPADWIVRLPESLSAYESMVIGTAGFTAAQCVWRLEQHGVQPSSGPVLVTGATGGVGCLAVVLLAQLGYHVVAVSGKSDRAAWLVELGAAEVLDRTAAFPDDGERPRPLASARWAGVVDTVGGAALAAAIRATQMHGCVAACGNVAGADLPLTVYPFILRGVTLAGVTSQNCPLRERQEIWHRLAHAWKMNRLDRVAHPIDLAQIEEPLRQIARGEIAGRVVVRVGESG